MIGMIVVEEANQIVKNVTDVSLLDVLIENCSTEDISFETYDFDTNSFMDLIEYTDFQDFTEYLFISVSQSSRLPKIVTFLNKFSDTTKFYFASINEIPEQFKHYIDEEKLISKKKTTEYSEISLENGLMALFTGIYPRIFKKNIIKHIYIEQSNDLVKIHPSLYLNCAINYGIYIDEPKNIESTEQKHIPGVVVFQDTLQEFAKELRLETISEEVLQQRLKTFTETGAIDWRKHKNGIIDYSVMLSLGLERGLFLFKDGLFLDYRRTKKIASDIGCSFAEIQLAKSSLSQEKEKNGLYDVYPLLINIALSVRDDELFFITPFNKNQFDSICLETYPSEWIVMSKSEGFFAFHIISNRLFEVNELFVEIFEADSKECLTLAKNNNSDITDEVIGEQKELMLSV